MEITYDSIQESTNKCLVEAGTTYRNDQFTIYQQSIGEAKDDTSRWVLEQIFENGKVAKSEQLPLCDDTGIPHAIVELGDECALPKGWMKALKAGIVDGLRALPGRPMAVKGNDIQRMEQSEGLYDDPGMLDLAPVIVKSVPGDKLKITVLMLGGGPEIRAKTRRVYHRRSIKTILGEAANWMKEEVKSLGCTPTILAIGIGRSQVEATGMMLEAMATGNIDEQNELEQMVTDEVNTTGVGPLGLGGKTVLGTLLKIGPARASGVRIVCVRPCCLVEPRRGTVVLG